MKDMESGWRGFAGCFCSLACHQVVLPLAHAAQGPLKSKLALEHSKANADVQLRPPSDRANLRPTRQVQLRECRLLRRGFCGDEPIL